jgi:hypothetical protein
MIDLIFTGWLTRAARESERRRVGYTLCLVLKEPGDAPWFFDKLVVWRAGWRLMRACSSAG